MGTGRRIFLCQFRSVHNEACDICNFFEVAWSYKPPHEDIRMRSPPCPQSVQVEHGYETS